MQETFGHTPLPPLPRRMARVAVWVLGIGMVTGVGVYILIAGFDFELGLVIGSMVTGVVYATVMLTAQFLSADIAERYIPLRTPASVGALIAIQFVSMIGSFLLATWLLHQLPWLRFSVRDGILPIILLVAVTGSLLGHGWGYARRFYLGMRNAEQAALRAELQALRAQINPHFLFNSLNSIAALTRTAPERAEEMTQALADLFRYSLRASTRTLVPLADELASVKLYLSIEKARFGARMNVEIDVPPELFRIAVPSLILQPVVENAVKHGLGAIDGDCLIRISASSAEGEAVIVVTDTGPGFSTTDLDRLTSMGIGLGNVRDRLLHELGGKATMEILPNGVRLTIPNAELPEGTLAGTGNPIRPAISSSSREDRG